MKNDDKAAVQLVWDELLVEAWWDNHSIPKMLSVYRQTLVDKGLFSSVDDLLTDDYLHPSIKRSVGLDSEHGYRCKTMPTFVSFYIPKLNAWLYRMRLETKRERSWIIDQVNRSPFDTITPTKKKRNRVQARRNKTDRAVKKVKQNRAFDPHKGHRRSDWGTVK